MQNRQVHVLHKASRPRTISQSNGTKLISSDLLCQAAALLPAARFSRRTAGATEGGEGGAGGLTAWRGCPTVTFTRAARGAAAEAPAGYGRAGGEADSRTSI